MYRTYRTTNITVFGEETGSGDTQHNLLHDIEGRKCVMVKNEKENAIYDLSIVGHITEIIHDVMFEEYRAYTYQD